jgi:outer membrane biogenesis lipoprotein LolB
MRAKLLAQLSALTGMRLTMRHYRDWLEGGPGYDHFDKAAKKSAWRGLIYRRRKRRAVARSA